MALRAKLKKLAQPKKKEQVRQKGFTPFSAPLSPPTGYYDPSLDAQQRASLRGLSDLTQDIGTKNLRETDDYNLALQRLGVQRTRGAEDYQRNVAQLDRNYQQLGSTQTQSARASGVQYGGALAQALRKRTANEAWDKAPIDQGFQRLNQNIDQQQGDLATSYQRGYEDRNLVQLPRAQREATQFGLDTNQQRWFQSKQVGYDPPTKPANERTVGGQTYRVLAQSGPLAKRRYETTTGSLLNRRQFVKRSRRLLNG